MRIDLAYEGTDYCGWQYQPNCRTVQGEVERALAELHGGRPVRVRGASRTDSGVHAHGQVADCEVRLPHDDGDLAYALGRLLPSDIRPLRLRTISPLFHSRKQAMSKTYHYRIDRSRHGNPFARRFALRQPGALDEGRIREALQRLPGRRDFSGFTTPRSDKLDPHRGLIVAELCEVSGESVFVFEADGFLRYMVRNLVGTLLAIGKGRFPVERVQEILDTGNQALAGPTAPAHGLHLMRVAYMPVEPPIDPHYHSP